jgi:hypothetical protein
MSGEGIAYAERHTLPAAHAIVLRTIGSSINKRLGVGWKSQANMASLSNGMSLPTLKRCIKDLKALQLVTVRRLPVQGRLTTTYTLGPTELIRWNRKEHGSWKQFVTNRQKERQAAERQVGESKQDYLNRTIAQRGIRG